MTQVVRRARTTTIRVILLTLQPHEVAFEQVDTSTSISLGEKQRETWRSCSLEKLWLGKAAGGKTMKTWPQLVCNLEKQI